ncbi:MAG: nitric oxide reductase large subunit, partial [Sphingobacteriaceae bacterium]|nr:nitric oxide reductase large subunit [Sphingobacteriaceae bacterium]
MKSTRKLWVLFAVVVGLSFATLGYYGIKIYQKAPPIPEKVVSAGKVLFTGSDIQDGQNVWQSIGGQEVGSIWGHGAYVAPDWTADWIHREAMFILDYWAKEEFGHPYNRLTGERKAALQARLTTEVRKNTFNEQTKTLELSPVRAKAFSYLSQYYSSLFADDPKFNKLREAYAIPKNSIKDPVRLKQINMFFFWASWACVAERPGETVSYTHNWPSEPLVGNIATGDLMIWTGFSVIMLLLGIGLLVFYNARNHQEEVAETIPGEDPLLSIQATPSMKATLKYFWVVTA